MSIQILFEDKYLLAIDKPKGISSDGQYGIEQQVRDYLNSLSFGNKLITGMPHRLDKPVSGILLFVKKRQALKDINKQFAQKTIKKIYKARVQGLLNEKEKTLYHFLVIDKKNKKAIISHTAIKKSFPVALSYKVLMEQSDSSLLEVELHTGKFHQIRAQLAFIGHPIVGDVKYGANSSYLNNDSISLHAFKLVFMHPVENNIV